MKESLRQQDYHKVFSEAGRLHTAVGTDIRGSYIFCLVFLSLYLGGSVIVPSGDSLFSQVRQQTVSEEQTGTDHAIQGMHLVCGKFSEKRICVGKCFSGKPGGYTNVVW